MRLPLPTPRAIGRLVAAGLLTLLLPPAAHAAVITVSTATDVAANDGQCSLREAIQAAISDTASGAAAGECVAGTFSDEIHFAIPGSGVHVITPASALPTITRPVLILGYTQPGAQANTSTGYFAGTNAQIMIEIDAAQQGNSPTLAVSGVTQSEVRIEGLALTNSNASKPCCAQSAIQVQGSRSVKVQGNFIGVAPDGVTARGNGSAGVFISDSDDITIGTDGSPAQYLAQRNLISGNRSNAVTTQNAFAALANLRIGGNLIGVNANADGVIGGVGGLSLNGLSSGQVFGNIIGGVMTPAIALRESSAVDINDNLIGAGLSTYTFLPNIGANPAVEFSDNVFASPTTLTGILFENNIVTHNPAGGVSVVRNNAANTVRGITLSDNRIYDNGSGLDIDLANDPDVDTVTANDAGDGDTGANDLTNFPVITSAQANGSTIDIAWSYSGLANEALVIEFFLANTCNASNHGGAFRMFGSTSGTSNGSGQANGSVQFNANELSGFVTATATDANGNTSEFSACLPVNDTTVYRELHLGSNPAGLLSLIDRQPGGASCGPGCYRYPDGSTITLTANSLSPFAFFTSWGGDCSGSGSCQLTMNMDHDVQANYFLSLQPPEAVPVNEGWTLAGLALLLPASALLRRRRPSQRK